MLLSIAAAEFAQQVRGHVFRVVFVVSALMVGGALAIDALRVGLDGVADGPATIVRVHLVWTLFYLFTAAAFVGEAVLRDRLTGMAPLVESTPVAPAALLYGRALGAFGAVLACFLSVPIALAMGAAVQGWAVSPWLFVWSFTAIAAPNLFLASALFLLLATRTASMAGCLIGAVMLLVLYGLGREGGGGVPPLLEPFGFARIAAGAPLWPNRLVWIGVAALCLLAARPTLPERGRRPRQATPARPLAQATVAPPAQPRFDTRLLATQMAARIWLEAGQLVRTPAFAVLVLLGLASAIARLWTPALDGAALHELLGRLIASFQLVPITVMLFFSGELYWNERATGMAPLVAASAVPAPVLYLGKLAALAMILLALALATGVAAGALHVVGGGPGEVTGIVLLYILPKWVDWMMFAALALLIQALSPNKLSGWGFVVLYLIASLGLDQAGFRDPLWRYGLYPGAPLPPALSGAAGASVYRWGWAAVALLLVAIGAAAATRRRAGIALLS